MKNSNLLNRLLSYSHEKQKPQRFGRYAAMLMMLLTLGVGQMWAGTSTTVYYAVPSATWSSLEASYGTCHIVVHVNYKGDGEDWGDAATMVKSDKIYNGKILFSASFTDKYDGLGAMYFKVKDGSNTERNNDKVFGNKAWTLASTYNGKIKEYNTSGWQNYAEDRSIYVHNDVPWAAVKLYTYNPERNGNWNTSSGGVTDQGDGWYKVDVVGAEYFILHSSADGNANKTIDKKYNTVESGKSYHLVDGSDSKKDLAEEQLTVTVNMHGHDESYSSYAGSYYYNELLTEVTEPSASGYIFDGWFKESTYDNEWDFANDHVTSDLTLHAKWLPQSLTITSHPTYLTTTDKLTLGIDYANIPSGYCYRVKVGAGYYNNSSGQDRDAISGTGSTTFTSNSGLPLGANTVVVELWKNSPFEKQSVVSDGVTVTVEQAYLVNVQAKTDGVESTTGGTVSPASVNASAHLGQTITASTPNTGYDFTGWTANTPNITFADPSALSTTVYATAGGWVYANYVRQSGSYSTTFYAGDHGSINAKGTAIAKNGSASVTIGENETLSATPETGYVFDHWETTGSVRVASETSATTTVTATDAGGTVTAYYRHRPELGAVTATPSGTQNYAGEPINFELKVTSTYMAHPVVVFLVNDGTTEYEVVGAPYGADGSSAAGTIGSDAANTTVHKATFTASAAKSYTVSAKLYEGLLLANFDGKDFTGGTGWEGSHGHDLVTNPSKQAVNGSNNVRRFTKGTNRWDVDLYRFAGANLGISTFRYAHTRQYRTETGKTWLKLNDDKRDLVKDDALSANTWQKVVYDNGAGTPVDFFYPLLAEGNTSVYFDDIILSNEETMMEKASQAATASFSINWNYTVTLNNNGATSAGTESVNVTYGSATGITDITVPTKTGYTFGGYYTADAGAGTLQINASGVWQNAAYVSGGNWNSGSNQTLYAKWTVKNYDITYSPASAPEGVTYTTMPSNADYNTTVNMVITPAADNNIVRVTAVDASSNTVTVTNPSTNTYSFTMPASDVTVSVSVQSLPIVYVMKSKNAGCIVPHGFEPTGNVASKLKLWAWKSGGTNFYNTSTYSWPGKSAEDENDVYQDALGNEWYRFIPDNTSDFDGSTSYSLIVTYNGTADENKIFASDISDGRKIYTDGVNVGGSTSSFTGSIWIIPQGSSGKNSAYCYTSYPAVLWSLYSNGSKVGDFEKIREDTYQLTVLASAITNYGAVCFSYNGKNYKLGNCALHTSYYSPATAATLSQSDGNFSWTGSPTGQIILTIFKSSGDWKIYYTPSYQVTYNDNGATTGTVPTDANYYTSGTSVTIKGNSGRLDKTGYNFAGWNGNASGTGTDYTPAETFSISNNTTLYAKWTPKNFSITYKDQGNVSFSGTHETGYPTSHTYNTATTLKSASKFGYTFDGWFTNSTCTGSAVTELGATDYTDDIILYAKWTINNHDITRTAPSGGSLSIKVGSADAVNTNTTSDYNQTVVLTTTPDFGYYLTGLTVTKTGDASTVVSVTNNTFTMPDYDVTITATYALRYGLIGQAADGEDRGMPGTEVASADDFTVDDDELVCPRNLDPNTTYLFKVYDRARTASRGYTTENTVLETGDSEELSGTYDLKLNTAGRGEYTFKITDISNDANAYPTVTVDRPTSYELTLKHGNTEDGDSYGGTVTAVATESETETAITDGQYVAAGGSIAFTTTVPSGYTFGGWYSDDDYAEENKYENGGNITITEDGDTRTLTISSISAAVNVYAKYTGNTYILSYDATTNGGNRIDVTKTVTMGRAYETLPTATRYGYTFMGWYTAPTDGTQVTDETIVTIASNHTIYAHFQEISYVYFYNNLGWSEVYATFNAYWNEDGKGGGNDLGTGNLGRPYYQLELVEGSSNVYRCQIPSYLTDKDWQYNIAFNNQKKLSKEDPLPTTGDWNNFNSGEAVFRRDFDSYATMFVPDPTEKVVSKNGVQYYSTDQWVDHQDNDPAKAIIDYRYTKGYWRKYNPNDYSDTYAGYVIKGSWDGEKHDYYFKRTAGLLGTDTFSVTVHLDKGQTYNFRIYKHCKTANTYSSWLIQNSGNTITRTITDADNYTLNMAIAKSETDKKDHITATVAGEYTFKLACGRDGVLQLLVDYPEIAADGNWYRALYTWVDKSSVTHTRVCKTFRRIDNSGTTWFEAFIHKSDAVTSRSLKLQKCTGITSNEPAWTDVVGGGITLSDADITETGVYTFTVTRNKNQQPIGSFKEKYDGVYYIRTDATEGGWDYYNSFGGYTMDYSAYSLTQTLSEPYSHYYCKFVDNTTTSVAFTVATYNSPSICDTLKNTDGIVTTYSFLPAKANVRFSYNEQTNALTRAYLKPATGDGNARYLVLHGQDTKVMDKDGSTIAKKGDGAEDMKANELLFSDEGDWIYSVTLKASPVAKASLIARYNGADRYLIGGAESYETILGGTESDTKYTLQATYNFKTNRLLMAWKPEGENISEALANVDMLWVRHAQDAAKEIKFTGSGSLSSIKVVGALEFDFNEVYGKVGSWNAETRRLIKFFISLPFDVAISDIFGLHEAEYGEAFIVQKYNGAKRAKDGLFAQDENTFWETLTVDSVMHANEGYCLMMDNYYMHGTQGSIWENKGSGSKVYLYLPSTGSISSISGGTQTITLPEHPCKIERTFTPEGGSGTVSHKNTDANWNFMGVPLFSSYTGEATSGYPGAIFVAEGTAAEGQGYLYKWDYSTNNYSINLGTDFNFLPMHSYLVQFAGNVTFSGSHIPASVAARQRKEKTNYNIDLQVLNTEDELVNRTYVELRENACDTFLLNEDLYLVTNSQPVNVFSFAGNYTVGANVLSVNNHIVPLGLIVRQNGTYTFSMPSNFSGTVTLIDTYAQTRTNLALDDYELYLERGTINDRFFLEININNAPTAIDGVTDGSGSLNDGKAHKFIMNDQMYILRDGVVYDAQGRKIE